MQKIFLPRNRAAKLGAKCLLALESGAMRLVAPVGFKMNTEAAFFPLESVEIRPVSEVERL